MSQSRKGFGALLGGASLALLMAMPVTAANYHANNGATVTPTGEAQFHVSYQASFGPADFWCAAGDYAIAKLRRLPNTRIYRSSPLKQRFADGVSFSLSQTDTVGATGLFGFPDDGSLSAGMAQQMCEASRLGSEG